MRLFHPGKIRIAFWLCVPFLFFSLAIGAAAQVTFSDKIVIAGGLALEACAVLSADLDGDGDYDVLSASFGDNKIAWYENVDGQGSFGMQRIITTSAYSASSVFCVDLDGDGDIDVLSSSWWDDKIAWYENLDGQGTFGPQRVITTDADGAMSVFSVDIDGDGDLDILSASEGDDKIAWYENGAAGQQHIITTDADGAMSVFSVDLDGDGDNDVLSASGYDDKIAWYENTDGQGSFGQQQIITTNADGARSVFSIDLDGDGDYDVISASGYDDKIAWYENTDGLGDFGQQQIIDNNATAARSVFSADIDGDGDYDVLTAASRFSTVAWYENLDGHGAFGPQRVVTRYTSSVRSVYSADIDGDGDYDVLSASINDNKIAWYENTDGLGSFGAQNVISPMAGNAYCVFTADVDGDGDNDVIFGVWSDKKIAWCENMDGLGSFGLPQIITNSASGTVSIYCDDLDGDGDNDIVSASTFDNKIAWYENTDGLGSFGPQQVVAAYAIGAQAVSIADMDGDGDNDIIAASSIDDGVIWYENTNGLGSFTLEHTIATNAASPRSIYCVDLDGDGDYDVLVASSDGWYIAWYENINGMGNFSQGHIITYAVENPSCVYSADIDGDGDYDVLSGSRMDDKIAWYENTNGMGAFGGQQIITTNVNWVEAIYSADLDGDGDYDVLSASDIDNEIAWFENRDGLGDFGNKRIICDSEMGVRTVISADMDGDGDNDVLFAAYDSSEVAWFRNETPIVPGLFPFHLLNPENEAQIENTLVQLIWESTIANIGDGGETSYKVYISENDTLGYDMVAVVTDTTYLFTGELDTRYFWKIKAESSLDLERWAEEGFWNFFILDENAVSSSTLPDEIPIEFAISSIYPNPFNVSTVVTVALPEPSDLTVTVYNITGRLVKTLASGSFVPGFYALSLNASDFATGIYFIRAQVPGKQGLMRKALLVK